MRIALYRFDHTTKTTVTVYVCSAARVHRARRRAFEPSGQLLAAIFQRSSGSYSLGNHPKL